MKALEIDGIVGAQNKDSQGETLDIKGADISDLEAGRGLWNDNHTGGFVNTLGRITSAKKVFKAEDCDTDRQKYYWNKVKAPFIYAKGYLFNKDKDHIPARATAAVIKSIYKDDCPLKIKASVEGGILERSEKDPSHLSRTKIRRIALTFVPANHSTLVEPISLQKSNDPEDKELIKSIFQLNLVKSTVPNFIKSRKVKEALKGGLADSKPDSKYNKKELKEGVKIEKEHTPIPKVRKEIAKDHLEEIPDYYTRLNQLERKAKKAKKMLKTLSAGMGYAGLANPSQSAALQKECFVNKPKPKRKKKLKA